LDADLHILHLENRSLEKAVQTIAEYKNACCGVDAPIERSHMLMAEPTMRSRLGLEPKQKNYRAYRVCEFELRRRGIHSYKTPVDAQKAPSWMQGGWKLYEQLQQAGYGVYPHGGSQVVFETYPHAAYTMLVMKRPYKKNTIIGRAQRQLVLYKEGVDVPDAMQIFEEFTRHRFLLGELALGELLNNAALDALIAAYTAFLLYREPHNVTLLGDLIDGQIVLPIPVQQLQEQYS
jgi:predicted nuclease with RNAse H fold